MADANISTPMNDVSTSKEDYGQRRNQSSFQRNNEQRGPSRGKGFQAKPPSMGSRFKLEQRGPPRARHLATQNSEIKSDPLYKEAIVGEPDIALKPRADLGRLHTGFDGLTTIINETYNKAVSTKTGFAKRVPESAFATYCATLTYARALAVHGDNSFRLTPDERDLITEVKSGQYGVPSTLNTYLNGVGNTRIPDGRELKFEMIKPRYAEAQVGDVIIPGYFERVDENTHYKYKSYPSLGVFYQRIIEDIRYSEQRARPRPPPIADEDGQEIPEDEEFDEEGNWDLPENIRPLDEDANFPTLNLLGYAPATRLDNTKLGWLRSNAGITARRLPVLDAAVPFSPDLMNAVWTELQEVKDIKCEPFSTSPNGSVGQLLATRTLHTRRAEIDLNLTCESSSLLKLPDIVSCIAGPFKYRMVNANEAYQSWSIYAFDNLEGVPDAWVMTRNMLREDEYAELDTERFITPEYSPKVKIRKYIDNDSLQKGNGYRA
nr:MAG: RNA-dependent RNA polymerase [Riboviria sp.]